ncbi:MAG: hypothetical protein V3W11_12970 [bacterium]
MKRGILLATAAATLLAAGVASAEGEDNGNGGKPFAATARFEEIWPAAGFDYTFAKRVSLGPVVKYDGESLVAGAASRFYFLADNESVGVKPYLAAESGYLRGADPVEPARAWNYVNGWVTTGEYGSLPYDCFYAFAGPGLDLRARGIDFVPFMEMGPRREFREGNEGIYLYWALGLRYTW